MGLLEVVLILFFVWPKSRVEGNCVFLKVTKFYYRLRGEIFYNILIYPPIYSTGYV